MLLYLRYKCSYLVRLLLGIKGCILLCRNSLVVEEQFFRIGNSNDLQVDISTLEDIGTCLKDLFNKGASHGTTTENSQVDTLGDFKYFAMNHIDRLGEVFFVHHHADVAPCSGVVNQQRNHLIANQCVIWLVKVGQVLSDDRNHAHLLHQTYPTYVVAIDIQFELSLQSLFGFLRILVGYQKADTTLRRALGDDTHTDFGLSQSAEDTCIHSHFSQQATSFEDY